MSASRLDLLLRTMRRRRVAIVGAFAVPLGLALAVAALRLAGPAAACTIAVAALAIALVAAWRAARAVSLVEVVRGLDAQRPAFEDSAELLLRAPSDVSPLQRLQQARLRERLAVAVLPDLRRRWPWRALLASGLLAAGIAVTAWRWPSPQAPAVTAVPVVAATDPVRATALTSVLLAIEAPAYTGLAARRESSLDAEAPEGSRLRWSLAIEPVPDAVELVFHDGTRLGLQGDGERWSGEHRLVTSMLYRIEVVGVPALQDAGLHRLDAQRDRAPELRVIEPAQTLTVLESSRPAWNLAFEASDDHGIAGAQLSVTLAQGSGEQVTVRQHDLRLRAEAGTDARQRRYRHRLDLAALGFARGDDVIVRLAVSDTREPEANVTRSASFILRWPPEVAAEAEGIDGIVQKVLPAYFRSQRQIIIDSEALLARKPALEATEFVRRADAIGVDQKILRLRYGQFLGEEFESGAAPASAAGDDDDHGAAGTALPEGHSPDDGHDHADAAFGDAASLVAAYGHSHDHAEAATLLDPQTRRILKAALDEMWQAELHLRSGDPRAALPFENRALDYIKQVQQASRIHLARVGLELPAVDESRRLGGDRSGVSAPRGLLSPRQADDAVVADFAAALADGEAGDAAALTAWLHAHADEVDDVLGVFAALDGWQRDRACTPCRERLLDRLWPLLPTPPTGVPVRVSPDAAGAAYLDALQAEDAR